MKKCWCQQNSRGLSRNSYIFLGLLWVRYNCAKFHLCWICVTDFREGGPFCHLPPICEQRKDPSWIGLSYQLCFFLPFWHNTCSLLWQYWSTILSFSLGLYLHPASHRQFSFYKKLLKCVMNAPSALVSSCVRCA